MPFRDVFDSSFDDVVNVSFLDVDESVQLVERRVVGMPLPFIFLCHCIAGGLARDVIRVAREVIGSNPGEEEGWPVHEACEAILKADLAAKIAATSIASWTMPPSPVVEHLRSWLQELQDMPVSAEALCPSVKSRAPTFSSSWRQKLPRQRRRRTPSPHPRRGDPHLHLLRRLPTRVLRPGKKSESV